MLEVTANEVRIGDYLFRSGVEMGEVLSISPDLTCGAVTVRTHLREITLWPDEKVQLG